MTTQPNPNDILRPALLTNGQWQYIINTLAARPYVEVFEIIEHLKRQFAPPAAELGTKPAEGKQLVDQPPQE